MSDSPHPVGYGRPPEHTRFQKGQSGNPTGKAGPTKRLRHQFDTALSGALEGDTRELRDARPANVIEALVRQIALNALDGKPSAQRLVVSLLERDSRGSADDEGQSNPAAALTSEERTREALGERYDEFKARFDAAVAAGAGDELLAIAREFQTLGDFPAAGNFAGNSVKSAG
jgi:hypothetical protein